jgi:hypothetical protein
MSKQIQFSGNWNNGHQEIIVNLAMIQFVEDGTQIVYCPALDITGYGKTEHEAKESFEVSLSEFFVYTLHKGTLFADMERLGWKIKKKGKPMDPPSMQQLLQNNDNFSRIFNNYPFHKFDKPVTIPAVA